MLEKILNKRNLAIGAILSTLALNGCGVREDAQANSPSNAQFSDPVVVDLSGNSSYAEKRTFNDFTGDGIEDMGEINDEQLFGQDYQMKVFPGYYNEDGNLSFTSEGSFKLGLPQEKRFFSSQTKIDSADVNGDGFGEIIFTDFQRSTFGDDKYNVTLALNDGEGNVKPIKVTVNESDSMDTTSYSLSRALALLADSSNRTYGTYASKTIHDFLKMDWADFTGDGKDDLAIFWKGRKQDLSLTVFPTLSADENGLSLGAPQGQVIGERFLYNRKIRRLDTEDFNGDGVSDIVVYYPVGITDSMIVSTALSNEWGGYTMQKDVEILDTDMDNLSFMGKFDSFDANNDGKADIAHIGVNNGKPVISYNITE